ncbi:hypothetical protein BC830DRAFT_1221680 [Chytriomyces sp. MP71]|nr:hypothetical protein BC830DRAFT_1221680 [Chytriomyces sp. MP71]
MMAAMNNASKSQQSQKNNLHHRHPPRASGALTNLDSELALLTDPHPLVRKDSASSASYAMGYTGLSSQHRNLATSFDLSQNPPHHQARPRHPSNPSSSAIPSYPISSYSHPKKSLSQSSRSLYGDCGSSDGLMLFGANNILADDAIFPGIAALDFDSVFSGDGRASQPYDPFEMHDLMAAERTSPKKSNWNPGTDVLPAATLESMSFESVFEYPSLDTDIKRRCSAEPSKRELVDSIIATVESSNVSPSSSLARPYGHASAKPSATPPSRRILPHVPALTMQHPETLFETSVPPAIVGERVLTVPPHSLHSAMTLPAAAPATIEACSSSTSGFRDPTRVDLKRLSLPFRETFASSLDDAHHSRGPLNIPPIAFESSTATYKARSYYDALSSRSLRRRSEAHCSHVKFQADISESANPEINATVRLQVEPLPPPPAELEQRIVIRIASPKVPTSKVTVSERTSQAQSLQKGPAFLARPLKIRLKTANSVVSLHSGQVIDATVGERMKRTPTDFGLGLGVTSVVKELEVLDASSAPGMELQPVAAVVPVEPLEEKSVSYALSVLAAEPMVFEFSPLQREEPEFVEVSPSQRQHVAEYLPLEGDVLERHCKEPLLQDMRVESNTMLTEVEVVSKFQAENLHTNEVLAKLVDARIQESLHSEVPAEEPTNKDASVTFEVPAILRAQTEIASSYNKDALTTNDEAKLGILERAKEDSTAEGGKPENDLDLLELDTAVENAMPRVSKNGMDSDEVKKIQLFARDKAAQSGFAAEAAKLIDRTDWKASALFVPENVDVESASINLGEPQPSVSFDAESRKISAVLSDAYMESALEAALDAAMLSDQESAKQTLLFPMKLSEILPGAEHATKPLIVSGLSSEAKPMDPSCQPTVEYATDIVKAAAPASMWTIRNIIFMDSVCKKSTDRTLNIDNSVTSSDPLTPDIDEASISSQPAINALPTPAAVAAVLPSKSMTTTNAAVTEITSFEERAGDSIQLASVPPEFAETPILRERLNQQRGDRAILEGQILEDAKTVNENTAMAAATMTRIALDALQTPSLPPAESKHQEVLFQIETHLPDTLTASSSTSVAETLREPTSSPMLLEVSHAYADDNENVRVEGTDMEVDVVDSFSRLVAPAVHDEPEITPAETLSLSEAAVVINDEQTAVVKRGVYANDSIDVDIAYVSPALASSVRPAETLAGPLSINSCLQVPKFTSSEVAASILDPVVSSILVTEAIISIQVSVDDKAIPSPRIVDSAVSLTAGDKATSRYLAGSSIFSERTTSPAIIGSVLSPPIPGTGRSPTPAVIEAGFSPAAMDIIYSPNVYEMEPKLNSMVSGQLNGIIASAFDSAGTSVRDEKYSWSETAALPKDFCDQGGQTDALVLVAESRQKYVKTELRHSHNSVPVDFRYTQGVPVGAFMPATKEITVPVVNEVEREAASATSSQVLSTPVLSSPVLENLISEGPPKKSKRAKRQIWAYVPIFPVEEEKPIDINEGRSLRTRLKQEFPDPATEFGRGGCRSKRQRTGNHLSTMSTPATRPCAVEETESPRSLRIRLKLQEPTATGPSDVDMEAPVPQSVSPMLPRTVPEKSSTPKLKLSVADVTVMSQAYGSAESVCKVCHGVGELLKSGRVPVVGLSNSFDRVDYSAEYGDTCLVKWLGHRMLKIPTQPDLELQLASVLASATVAQSSSAGINRTSPSVIGVTQKVKIRLPQPKLRMYATAEGDDRPAPGTIPANTVFRISESTVIEDFLHRIRQANLTSQGGMTSGVRKGHIKLSVAKYQRLLELERIRNDAA